MVSGASASSIGHYVMGPWLYMQVGVTVGLYRIDDYASDALLMNLASAKTICKMLECDFADTGNAAIVCSELPPDSLER